MKQPQPAPDYLTSGRHGDWYVVATWPDGARYVLAAARTRDQAEAEAAALAARWEGGPQLAVEMDFSRALRGSV